MKTKKNPASEAAKLLRAIPSKRRSQQSRVNGRKGGRPPLPSCSVRELRRRVREYCRANDVHCVRELLPAAMEMREMWNSPPCSGYSLGDLSHDVEFPLDCQAPHRQAIARLVPRDPVLL